jgi:two-component system NtrC family response regulator
MKRSSAGDARASSDPDDVSPASSPTSSSSTADFSAHPLGAQYLTEFAPLLGVGRSMQPVKRLIEDVASTDATVLVLGESGVGKDLVARAIHAASHRRNGPFVKVNCAALPGELLETEFFGHEKGAFTGAYRRKPGKFEFANHGTICLDEIGEMPRLLQAKLLHVLQDLQFSRVGGDDVIRVDARVVATTNRNLEAAIASGDFREDLYYRLGVVEIRVPPLRERKDTLPTLIAYHLARFNKQYGRQVQLSTETLELFMAYAWPGNVRELENRVKRAVIMTDGKMIGAGDLDLPCGTDEAPPTINLRAAREVADRRAIRQAMSRTENNISGAAKLLGISRPTLYDLLKQYRLQA